MDAGNMRGRGFFFPCHAKRIFFVVAIDAESPTENFPPRRARSFFFNYAPLFKNNETNVKSPPGRVFFREVQTSRHRHLPDTPHGHGSSGPQLFRLPTPDGIAARRVAGAQPLIVKATYVRSVASQPAGAYNDAPFLRSLTPRTFPLVRTKGETAVVCKPGTRGHARICYRRLCYGRSGENSSVPQRIFLED